MKATVRTWLWLSKRNSRCLLSPHVRLCSHNCFSPNIHKEIGNGVSEHRDHGKMAHVIEEKRAVFNCISAGRISASTHVEVSSCRRMLYSIETSDSMVLLTPRGNSSTMITSSETR
jgi:hypothetical protein